MTRLLSISWLAAVAILAAGCGGSHGGGAEISHEGLYPTSTSHAVTKSILSFRPTPVPSGELVPCSSCHVGGKAPEKPAGPAFPHRFHLDRGLQCTDCHDPEGTGTPSLPSTDICFSCHNQDLSKENAHVQAFFASRKGPKGGYTFEHHWKVKDVKPVHPVHAKHQVECTACHGKATNEPFVMPKPAPLMQRCLDCHQQHDVPTTCETCHNEHRGSVHPGVKLVHGGKQMKCMDCHTKTDMDFLHLANGTKIPFDKGPVLCAQCHGQKMQDVLEGFHGKRSGHWNGTKEVWLCLSCHSPHSPRFPSLKPLPPPHKPETIR